MVKPFCDECQKPLAEAQRMINIGEIVFFEMPHQPRGQRGLHFCDMDCLRSWGVKAQNKPNIIQIGQQ